jgi:hypothetical protein
MEIIIGVFCISIFLFFLHSLSMATTGESLLEGVIGWFKEIYLFFKNIKQ